MTNKDALDYMYNIAISNSGDFEKADKVRECYNKIADDLEILEIIKKWSFLDTFYREDTDTTYNAFICNIHTKGMKKDFEKVKEWLDGKD